MKICVAGWYFDGDYMNQLSKISSKYDVTIVSHVDNDEPKYSLNGLKIQTIPNIGLEFGCYDYYLKKIWDGDSDILFTHDDIRLSDISIFDRISELNHDCAYIFRDKAEERANGGKHGRAIFCSKSFLQFIRTFECNCQWRQEQEDSHNPGTRLPKLPRHTGFWYDPKNKGHVCGKPPEGVRHYNEAIYHFHWTLGRVRDRRCGPQEYWPNPVQKMDVVNRVFFDGWEAGRRNLWRHKEREQKKYAT